MAVPGIGTVVHVTPSDHAECWAGTVIGGDDASLLAHVVYPVVRVGRTEQATAPQQMYVGREWVTDPDPDREGERTTWHWPQSCPWER